MKKHSGYVVLLLTLIVSAIGVTLAINSLLVSTQVTDIAIGSEQSQRADSLARSCAEVAIERLIQTQTYGGDETILINTESCRILTISGVANGDRVIHTQATVESVTRYIETRLSTLAPQVKIEEQKNISQLSAGTGDAGILNTNNPFLLDPTALQLWMKASSVIGTNDYGLITTVPDSSANDHFAQQLSESRRPVFRRFGLNNLPIMVFDGTDDFLNVPDANDIFSNTTGLSVFVVGLSRNSTTTEAFVGEYDDSDTDDLAEMRQWRMENDDFGLAETATTALDSNRIDFVSVADTYRLLSGVWDPGSAPQAWLNAEEVIEGDAPVSVQDLDVDASGIENVTIGAYRGGDSHRLEGAIAEIIVYNRALTTSERQSIEIYLNTKYNLWTP